MLEQIASDADSFRSRMRPSLLGVDSHAGRSLRSALNFLGPDFWDFGNSSFR
jgi:hypothetical protein